MASITAQLNELLLLLSGSTAGWHQLLSDVFADGWSAEQAERIRADWQQGHWGFNIAWVGEQTLPNAWGALPETGDTILLNTDRLQDQPLAFQAGIAIEEIGHWLDRRLRPDSPGADTPGDEGLAFARAVAAVQPAMVISRLGGGPETATLTVDDGLPMVAELASAPYVGVASLTKYKTDGITTLEDHFANLNTRTALQDYNRLRDGGPCKKHRLSEAIVRNIRQREHKPKELSFSLSVAP